jgi:hypothetical protein
MTKPITRICGETVGKMLAALRPGQNAALSGLSELTVELQYFPHRSREQRETVTGSLFLVLESNP